MPGESTRQMPVVEALTGGACLTTAALAEMTGLDDRNVAKACCSLVSRGWVVRRERGCFELSDVGTKAIAAGEIITSGPTGALTQAEPRRPRRTTVRDKMWLTIRTLMKVRIADLETLAGATRDNAQRYVGALEKAGFLSRLRPEVGSAPTSNGFCRWLLVRNSGPAAPVYKVRASEIYDRNTRISYTSPEEQAEVAALVSQEAADPVWNRVFDPQPFDVLLFRRGRLDTHVGLYVDRSFMLHLTADDCAKLERFETGTWAHRLTGIFRHVEAPSNDLRGSAE